MKNWQKSRNYRRIKDKNGNIIANIITVDGVDVEVTEEVFLVYSQADRRERYITEELEPGKVLFLDKLLEDNVLLSELGVEQEPSAEEIALDREDIRENALQKAELAAVLSKLDEKEIQLIQALFFEGVSTREYACRTGVTQRAIIKRRDRILRDIKKRKDLLPAQGMPERPEQIALSHRMLEIMQDGGIALCDAGTGIGKTYAYLVAGTVFHGQQPSQPVLISTSSIALQKAVRDEYLPFLSMVLSVDGMITEPIQAVIRKGKSHYVCDQRLERRLGQLDLRKKNWRAGNALLSLREKLDLDKAPRLSGYDRERVCVPKVCDCQSEKCRYRSFLDSCDGSQYPFQICNHNLLLADAIHRGTGRQPILPDSLAIIIDEAHKLPETARQMFGVTLRAEDIQGLIHDLRREKYLLAADALADTSRLFLRKLERPHNPDRRFSEYARLLVAPNRALTVVRKQVNPLLSASTRRRLDKLASTMTLFSEDRPDMVFYLAEDARDTVMLCATVADLTAQLQSTLWNQPRPIIPTSGTLAVGSDFHRFREEAACWRIAG